MEKVVPNSKLVGHSTEINRQSKTKAFITRESTITKYMLKEKIGLLNMSTITREFTRKVSTTLGFLIEVQHVY